MNIPKEEKSPPNDSTTREEEEATIPVEDLPKLLKWVWEREENGNILIRALNQYKRGPNLWEIDYIRRAERHIIYCVALETNFYGSLKVGDRTFKFCKVGETNTATTTDLNSPLHKRVVSVQKKIIKANYNYKMIFQLPISGTDKHVTKHTELRLRKVMGYLVDEKLSVALGLPYPTEWVLSTERLIHFVEERIKDPSMTTDTSIFDNFSTTPEAKGDTVLSMCEIPLTIKISDNEHLKLKLANIKNEEEMDGKKKDKEEERKNNDYMLFLDEDFSVADEATGNRINRKLSREFDTISLSGKTPP